jgi:hypothetical protein
MNTKQSENGNETHYISVGNIDCNVTAMSCALITVEIKGVSNAGHNILLMILQDDISERVQRRFRETYGNVPPKSDSIRSSYRNLVNEERMFKNKNTSRQRISMDTTDRVRKLS